MYGSYTYGYDAKSKSINIIILNVKCTYKEVKNKI